MKTVMLWIIITAIAAVPAPVSPDTAGRIAIPTGDPVCIDGDGEWLRSLPDGTIEWAAPVGDRVLFYVPLPEGVRFGEYGLLKIDVEIEGGPVDIMVFLERPHEKRWVYRPVDVNMPPPGRRTLHLDLAQPEIVRESHFRADKPRIAFQCWSFDAGRPGQEPVRRILIGNIRLVKRRLDVRWNGIDYASERDGDGAIVYRYPVSVVNTDTAARLIDARIEPLSRGCADGVIVPESAEIAPGDSTVFTVRLAIPGDVASELPPFYCEWFLPVFSCAGVADSDEGILRSSDRIALPAIVMPEIESPVVPFDRAGLDGMLSRYRETAPGKREGDGIVGRAEKILAGDPAIPDGPGWARAYYYCHEHRCVLEHRGEDRHYCPVGGEFRDVDFMGVDLDRDYRAGEHNAAAARARTLALAFALTGDDRFARGARNILRQYRERYFTWDWLDLDASRRTIDKGRLHFAKYMETYAVRSMIEALDLLGASGGIPDSEARDLERNLLLPALVEITDYRMDMFGRQTTITTTALIGGLSLKHAPLVAFAVHSPFGYFSLRRWGATADGIGRGHGYAQYSYTLHQAEMAEFLYRYGLDTFDHELKRLIDCTYWWGVPMRPERLGALFSIAARHYPDPVYRRYARRSLMDEEPPPLSAETVDPGTPPSVNFPHSGLTILRRPAPGGGTLDAEFKWGMPDNRGEFSVLSLGIECYGYRCQSYPGHFHWGSTDLHHGWQIQSASHTTIVVDRHNHSGMKDYFKGHYMPHPSEQVYFSDGPRAAATVAFNDRIYPGVRIWRAVCVLDGACLVMDALMSDGRHTYDWWFHGVPDRSNGRDGIGLALSPRPAPLGAEDGYQTVERLSSAMTGDDVRCDWTVPGDGSRGESALSLRILNDAPLEVVHGFEWSRQFSTPEKEFLLLRRGDADNAGFIVLVEPRTESSRIHAFERMTVKDIGGGDADGVVGVYVVLGETSYEIVFNPLEKTYITTGGGMSREVFDVIVR